MKKETSNGQRSSGMKEGSVGSQGPQRTVQLEEEEEEEENLLHPTI